MDHRGYGLQREQELALKNAGMELLQNTFVHRHHQLPKSKAILTSSSPILANSYRKAKYSVRCLLWGLTPCSMMDSRVFTKRVTHERLPMSSTGPSMSSELAATTARVGIAHSTQSTKSSSASPNKGIHQNSCSVLLSELSSLSTAWITTQPKLREHQGLEMLKGSSN